MTTGLIHPTAQIAAGAKLGRNVSIGPYAVIGQPVTIGDHCEINAHAVIHPYVEMGCSNRIHPHAVIGGVPQDIGFDAGTETWLIIGNGNVFREGVTINRATRPEQPTRIADHTYFMNNSHVAHDCRVGDHAILATSATLGGFVELGERVFLGGGVMVHQFCRIGSLAMVAGVLGVRKDVLPFALLGGNPVRHYRINSVGLRRAGLDAPRMRAISQAFRCLRQRQDLSGVTHTPDIDYLLNWLAAGTKRGIYGFAGNTGGHHRSEMTS
jgi:UDP-N-acetylglucosamine acyltransferase